jgi:hypothetical protein
MIGAELKFAESEIFESISEMNKQIKRTSFASGQDPDQGSTGAASDSLGLCRRYAVTGPRQGSSRADKPAPSQIVLERLPRTASK